MTYSTIRACLGALLVSLLPVDQAWAHAWSPSQLADLAAVAANAPAEGLPPESEPLAELARLRSAQLRGANVSMAIDQTADALFAHLALIFSQGGVEPALADPTWLLPRPAPADMTALSRALDANATPSSLLQGLLPASSDYQALRSELAHVSTQPEEHDIDGASEDDKIVHLRAGLERLRWLPRQLPSRRLEVRVSQFQVMFYRESAPPLELSAIVGAPRSQTPTFQAEVRAITLNPSWEPPRSIVNELLPQFRRDPSKAAREQFDVLTTSGAVVDPAQVNWSARPFPYRLRQRPGPGNALGQIRFDLPNPYAIYLHDTPNRTLFERSNRALSHGCIRVENPAELAAAVIGDPTWSADIIRSTISDGQTRTIQLNQPTPIYVLYLTAAAGDDGSVVYFNDVYHRDAALVRALDSPQVTLAAQAERVRPRPLTCEPS